MLLYIDLCNIAEFSNKKSWLLKYYWNIFFEKTNKHMMYAKKKMSGIYTQAEIMTHLYEIGYFQTCDEDLTHHQLWLL